MKNFNWKALWQAIKEPLRLLAIAFVAFIITQVAEIENPEQWVVIATFILRFVDKWLHEAGKARDNRLMAGGLTRF